MAILRCTFMGIGEGLLGFVGQLDAGSHGLETVNRSYVGKVKLCICSQAKWEIHDGGR